MPYVTLAAMTFPAILHATDSIWSGLAALVVGVLVAWFSGNLFFGGGVGVSDCIPGRTHRVKFGMGLEGWCFVRKAGDAGESGCLPGG